MNKRLSLRYASLLHDIGKFWQGAEGKGLHQDLSAQFIRQYLPDDYQSVTFCRGHHDTIHAFDKEYKLLKILMLADWFSSGERKPEDDENKTRKKRKNTPMQSIFSQVMLKGNEKSKEKYIPLGTYNLDDLIRPEENIIKQDLTLNYKELWNNFCHELKDVKKDDPDNFFFTLYYLLKKYTSFIPSAVWYSKADVSLFDHMKTTCAISDCLYAFADDTNIDNLIDCYTRLHKNEPIDKEKKATIEKPVIQLIGGDVSGIQNFIYTIISKRATKSLKGRSLYIDLLTEAVAKYILETFGLCIANLLYCAGGRFYILAPSNLDITEIRKEISKRILKEFNGHLYIALDSVNIYINDFLPGLFSKKWGEVGRLLNKRKMGKFKEILDTVSFEPRETTDSCNVCGNPVYKNEELIVSGDVKKCRLCKLFEDLAVEFDKDYLIWIKNNAKGRNGVFPVFDRGVLFSNSIPKADDILSVVKINDTTFKEKLNHPFEFRFLLSSKRKVFDELADKSQGLKRWGVIKGDVDNLGRIFSEGLGDFATISRMSTLSGMISYFFSGWMHRICLDFDEYVYPVYSGGDDFFIIASWDKIPLISKRIYDDFRVFTCNNPSITLSIGTDIAPSVKYPISKISGFAEKNLEKAKNQPGKDGMVLFGKPFKWNDFNSLYRSMEKLSEFIENNKVSHSFLQKINSVYYLYENEVAKHGHLKVRFDDRYGKWRWLLSYLVARERFPRREEWMKFFSENIRYMDVIIRWIEFKNRGG